MCVHLRGCSPAVCASGWGARVYAVLLLLQERWLPLDSLLLSFHVVPAGECCLLITGVVDELSGERGCTCTLRMLFAQQLFVSRGGL